MSAKLEMGMLLDVIARKRRKTVVRKAENHLTEQKIILPQMPIMPPSETMVMDENLIMASESLNNFPESRAINQTDLCLALKLMLCSLSSTEH